MDYQGIASMCQRRRAVSTLLSFALLAGFVITVSGCRFKFPTSSEGAHLLEQNVFAEGNVPAWVNQNKEEKPVFGRDSGLVPQTYSVPPAVQSSRAVKTSEPSTEQTGVLRPGEAAEDFADEDGGFLVNEEDGSPLDRIERECPGVESAVSAALRTEEASQRIRRYEDLTRKCPTSADLWLWLGKDYQSQGRLVEANRAFENVLVYDPGNEAARALLAVVRRTLNQAPDSSGK